MSDATAQLGEASTSSSSTPATTATTGKPVVVRVKRKASQPPLDAFWLEINERPLKRQLFDLSNLSISDALVGKVVERFGPKKVLVQHIETVRHSKDVKDVLNSFLQQDSSGSTKFKRKAEEHRSFLQHDKKRAQLLSVSRKEHENLVRNARFEQIWKSRREAKDIEESFQEICHLYDVVRVDSENETSEEEPYSDVGAAEESAILCNYLPLLREYLPEAAVEIESLKSKAENFVYDVYTVDTGLSTNMEDANGYPLVQVNDDDEFYDPLVSEYESDDSNAEDNPRNDYPDEESSGDEDKESRDPFDDLEGSDSQYEDEVVDVDEENEQGWRWSYR